MLNIIMQIDVVHCLVTVNLISLCLTILIAFGEKHEAPNCEMFSNFMSLAVP